VDGIAAIDMFVVVTGAFRLLPERVFLPVCGELLISSESAIRHTQVADARKRRPSGTFHLHPECYPSSSSPTLTSVTDYL
jgi:hypothetical protein